MPCCAIPPDLPSTILLRIQSGHRGHQQHEEPRHLAPQPADALGGAPAGAKGTSEWLQEPRPQDLIRGTNLGKPSSGSSRSKRRSLGAMPG